MIKSNFKSNKLFGKVLAICLMLTVLSLTLTGCSKMSEPTDGDFMLACDSVDLSAVSQSTTGTDQEHMDKLYIAQSDNEVIEFIQYDNETSASELFATIENSISNSSANVEKDISTSFYSKYYLRNGDKYQAVVRVGKVVIYGKEDVASGNVDKVLEYLGLD